MLKIAITVKARLVKRKMVSLASARRQKSSALGTFLATSIRTSVSTKVRSAVTTSLQLPSKRSGKGLAIGYIRSVRPHSAERRIQKALLLLPSRPRLVLACSDWLGQCLHNITNESQPWLGYTLQRLKDLIELCGFSCLGRFHNSPLAPSALQLLTRLQCLFNNHVEQDLPLCITSAPPFAFFAFPLSPFPSPH